jgi:hypothetical protein
MNRIALKTVSRLKKAPIVVEHSTTFAKQIQQVSKSEETLYYKKPTESVIFINEEYDETSSLYNSEKTLREWCDIKGISISDLIDFNPETEISNTPNVSGVTRIRMPKVSNATDICIITLGEFIKFFKNKLDYVSQTRLYYKKHEGFLPEDVQQREKDLSGDTSYYSMLSCEAHNIEKLKQYIKMNIRVDKVKWLN